MTEAELWEARRLSAAREWWHRRTQPCPRPLNNGRKITWGELWARMYGAGQTLEQYRESRRGYASTASVDAGSNNGDQTTATAGA